MMEIAETSNGRLVAQRDDLQVQRCPGVNEKAERVKQRDRDRRHESTLSENVGNLNRHNGYGVFSRHSSTPMAVPIQPGATLEVGAPHRCSTVFSRSARTTSTSRSTAVTS
jgi:hypothetical protein